MNDDVPLALAQRTDGSLVDAFAAQVKILPYAATLSILQTGQVWAGFSA